MIKLYHQYVANLSVTENKNEADQASRETLRYGDDAPILLNEENWRSQYAYDALRTHKLTTRTFGLIDGHPIFTDALRDASERQWIPRAMFWRERPSVAAVANPPTTIEFGIGSFEFTAEFERSFEKFISMREPPMSDQMAFLIEEYYGTAPRGGIHTSVTHPTATEPYQLSLLLELFCALHFGLDLAPEDYVVVNDHRIPDDTEPRVHYLRNYLVEPGNDTAAVERGAYVYELVPPNVSSGIVTQYAMTMYEKVAEKYPDLRSYAMLHILMCIIRVHMVRIVRVAQSAESSENINDVTNQEGRDTFKRALNVVLKSFMVWLALEDFVLKGLSIPKSDAFKKLADEVFDLKLSRAGTPRKDPDNA